MNGGLVARSSTDCRHRSPSGRLLTESCNYSKHQYLGSLETFLCVMNEIPNRSLTEGQVPQ